MHTKSPVVNLAELHETLLVNRLIKSISEEGDGFSGWI